MLTSIGTCRGRCGQYSNNLTCFPTRFPRRGVFPLRLLTSLAAIVGSCFCHGHRHNNVQLAPPGKRKRDIGSTDQALGVDALLQIVSCHACSEAYLRQYSFCWRCGVPPAVSARPCSVPDLTVPIVMAKLEARREQVTLAMAGRAGPKRKRRVAELFDAFLRSLSGGLKGWADATPDDVFDYLCYLDSHGGGTKWVHDRSCPGLGLEDGSACLPEANCGTRYACDSLKKGVVSLLRSEYKEALFRGDGWDPVSGYGNPCSSSKVESYLTFASDAQKQGGVEVKQAPPLLLDVLAPLLDSMRIRAMATESLSESMSIIRDIALFSLAFYTMRRGFDISNTLGSQLLRLPDSGGWIVNFQFGKTTRTSTDAKVVLPDPANKSTCPLRAVGAYLDTAVAQGWDLSRGHLFPHVTADGQRGQLPLLPHQMTAALQKHLRAAGLPDHFTLHSFRVGGSVSQSLAGTHIDAIMEMGGWKTRKMAEHYVGVTCSDLTDSEAGKPLDAAYRESDVFSLTPEFQAKYAACGQRK